MKTLLRKLLNRKQEKRVRLRNIGQEQLDVMQVLLSGNQQLIVSSRSR